MRVSRNPIEYLLINADNCNQRIDNYLHTYLKGAPKSFVYRILRTGQVRVNKKRVKPSYRIQSDDLIKLPPIRYVYNDNKPILFKSPQLELLRNSILYEDEGILILNKPSGMAVHGGSKINFGIIEALRMLRPELPFLELVHRLDQETSGILMIAKKRSLLRGLHEQLRLAQIQKEYVALVHGHWPRDQMVVNAPLLKKTIAKREWKMRVHPLGKPSQTQFTVVERLGVATLLNAKPITGRTHQIRVHALEMGYPIVFDTRYGNHSFDQQLNYCGLNRLFLHACAISFIHPQTGKYFCFEAPLDGQLEKSLVNLREKIFY